MILLRDFVIDYLRFFYRLDNDNVFFIFRIVCEGLAYAVTVYFGLSGDQPLDNIGCGKKDIFAVLKDLKSDNELNAYLKEESDKRHDDIINKSRLVTFLEVLYGTRSHNS